MTDRAEIARRLAERIEGWTWMSEEKLAEYGLPAWNTDPRLPAPADLRCFVAGTIRRPSGRQEGMAGYLVDGESFRFPPPDAPLHEHGSFAFRVLGSAPEGFEGVTWKADFLSALLRWVIAYTAKDRTDPDLSLAVALAVLGDES